jgi:hypothetical protein
MVSNESSGHENKQFGITTRMWAGLCHSCGICAYANRRPDSNFGRLMSWHRTWCPGWASHTKVYGLKDLTGNP